MTIILSGHSTAARNRANCLFTYIFSPGFFVFKNESAKVKVKCGFVVYTESVKVKVKYGFVVYTESVKVKVKYGFVVYTDISFALQIVQIWNRKMG